ncbi:MAG TPA: superoxide dismutase family protein [Gemmataceae bacterium]|nr:superoxide dismutase family protein [Gemmataceae bacterium]
MKKLVIALLLLAAPLVLVGAKEQEKAGHAGPKNAVAVIHGFGESRVKGVVHFMATEDGVVIRGEISGLKPGKHGFHIHQFGDVSSADPKCHGGHFNPEKKKHGGPHTAERHVGDLGNITADASGKATINMTDKLIALSGSHSIVGRAVIIHGGEDDMKFDPHGNAGPRVAGGVVGLANPAHK